MSKVKYQTKWIQYLLIPATLAVFSQGSFAHTRLEYPNVIEKGSVHNRLNVGHGCAISANNIQIISLLNLFVRENDINENPPHVPIRLHYFELLNTRQLFACALTVD